MVSKGGAYAHGFPLLIQLGAGHGKLFLIIVTNSSDNQSGMFHDHVVDEHLLTVMPLSVSPTHGGGGTCDFVHVAPLLALASGGNVASTIHIMFPTFHTIFSMMLP